MHGKVLIVDDEQDIRLSLRGILEDEGYQVVEAESGEHGLAAVEPSIDLILLDIWLPGMDGLQVLTRLHEKHPDIPVIMISGHGNIQTAVQAIKNGAFDFIEKPLSLEKVLITSQKALEFSSLRRENRNLRLNTKGITVRDITGQSGVIRELRQAIDQVAPTEAWVLITGENGTGKEIVARSIHIKSKRADQTLVAVNCAAIPEELIESELFGHEKGSFTGASGSRQGKFELAHQGTLFLDEIGDMSLKTQAKILRILQEQSFERVGGHRTISVNVRVIAATNKDLLQEIKKGNFREDLYYRLNVFPLNLPPLRERKEDIPILLEEFIHQLSQEHNFKPLSFTREAVAVLQNHSWPGNVRELKNFVERLYILYQGQEVTPAMLPGEISCARMQSGLEPAGFQDGQELPGDFKQARSRFEAWFLDCKLKEYDGNISRLAEAIGLERSYLYRKLKSYDISTD
ncbi:sigma-54-dependent transcriptional regulator [Desulfonatronovibrio hydrogenovorans]|uniref:sigma-54-dependent transcriptional regulator n=1 Tax=Desulfonatronovibrio hydrogenovorans TaxID=53245 RepID=UPI00048D003C|nr:sigma-54 dependent transcriptional regulator [Desulfonatronovibrio hydrogenovorans]